MNKKKYLIIHAGYPRALSTYFQKNIFSPNKEIKYYGKPYKNKKLEEIIYGIMFLTNKNFSKVKLNYILQLKKLFNNNSGNVIISDEIFACLFLFTTNNFKNNKLSFKFEKYNIKNEMPNLETSIIRIKKLFIDTNIFDDLKIIFFLRNQNEILVSFFYKHYSFFKKNNIYSFGDLINHKKHKYVKKIFFDNFDYFKTINAISNEVNINNIGVFLIEKFRDNPNLFFIDLNTFLKTNLSINKSLYKIKVNRLNSNLIHILKDKFNNFILLGDFSITNIFSKFKFLLLTIYKKLIHKTQKINKKEKSNIIKIKSFYIISNQNVMSEFFKNTLDHKYFRKYYL